MTTVMTCAVAERLLWIIGHDGIDAMKKYGRYVDASYGARFGKLAQ